MNYKLPPIDLLNTPELMSDDNNNQIASLQDILNSFNIPATVEGCTRGVRITQYEVRLEKGVPISKLKKIIGDIALWFGVENIRMVPIPEKKVIGLEVPNANIETIGIRSILDTPKFCSAVSKTTFGVGEAITGEKVIADLKDAPHMLIAGTTGSGKSVFINTLLTSILFKASPEDVRFIMIDPKMVELVSYDGLPHLLAPVITNPNKALKALKWTVEEMDRRYALMSEAGVRDYQEYSSKTGIKIPQIVIIIDELADLIMTQTKSRIETTTTETLISRLAQKARAGGIHLVVATQRPDRNIVTGLIKANIPTRVAFTVSSKINSNIILDEPGAEVLLGKGDMLFSMFGSQKPVRVQGAYISDSEIESIVSYIIDNNKKVAYDEKLMELLDDRQPRRNRVLVDPLWTKDGKNLGAWERLRQEWAN